MVKHIWSSIEVPLTLLGGAGSMEGISKLVKKFGIIGLSAWSLFVFKGMYRAVLISYSSVIERYQLSIDFLSGTETLQ